LTNINPEHKKQVEEKLNDEGKEQLNKLSKLQLLQVAKQTRKLYNNICSSCQKKIYEDSTTIKEIDDLCEMCQEKYTVKNVFIKLQGIFQKIK